jgi:membrane protease YdiL (CAAX protease family)
MAVVGLWPFLRSLGVRSWAGVGLGRLEGRWQTVALGFAFGLLSVAVVVAPALAFGARRWDQIELTHLPMTLAGSAAAGLVVGVMEELLFRGALFAALRRQHPWAVALAISSAVYAIMHFFQRVQAPAGLTWASGYQQLLEMMGGFVELDKLIPGFLSLTLVGMALGIAYHRTGNLYLSIGLHAGLVFWIKMLNELTVTTPKVHAWLRVSKNLYDGWPGLAGALLALGLVCFVATNKEEVYAGG